MKRFSAILAVALMAACTAFAADQDNNASDINNSMSGQSSQTTTTVKKSEKTAKAGQTCTDESGNVLKKGEPGFQACWNAEHPAQESGIAGKNKKENKMESNKDMNEPSSNNEANPNNS